MRELLRAVYDRLGEVASPYVAPTGGGYRRVGHVCAYHRGYNDGRRGMIAPAKERWERAGHRAAYNRGCELGTLDRETLGVR